MDVTRPTAWSALRENALLLVTYGLGAVLLGLAWWPLAPLYLVYCLASNVVYMAWVCPYCPDSGRGTGPAGYHVLSGGRFRPRPGGTFGRQFGRAVVVLAGGWFVPLLASAWLLIRNFSWPVVALAAVFCLAGFVLLPADSRRHCSTCDNQDCPRYLRRRAGPSAPHSLR